VRADRPGDLEPTALEQAAWDAAGARNARSDRAQLRRLGIVPTPLALVRFALSRIERALREELEIDAGFSSPAIEVIDPAVGTGVWLSSLLGLLTPGAAPARIAGLDADAEVLKTAERVLAPAAHQLPTALVLRHANTLALPTPWSAHERVRVMIGNPPWGARSASRGVALSDAWLREFHHDPAGASLQERRSGVLSDDYVRFFRWALQQAREAPRGALIGFVTNASWLDGPVHRGMRGALAGAFDRLEIVDLGGNSLRSLRGTDQSLFPVRVGAALTLCVRKALPRLPARVTLATLRGSRQHKLQELAQNTLSWSPAFVPTAPSFALRAPRADSASAGPDHAACFSLDDAFVFHAEGVQTNRDDVATAPDATQLRAQLERFVAGRLAVPASGHFCPELARRRVREALESSPSSFGSLAYRPFEMRAYCHVAPLCHRPRPLLARAVAQSQSCLLSTRKEPGDAAWNMFALVRGMADSSFLSTRSSCRTRVFPSHGPEGEPNLSPALTAALAERIDRVPQASEVVAYIAGVLGAPAFRAAHAEALRCDYARVPWPADAQAFAACVAAGQRFEQLLSGRAPVSEATLCVSTQAEPDRKVPRRALRWLSPQLLEVGEGARIGAGNERSFHASVGHHAIVMSAYRSGNVATIAALVEACARALMWGEAEQAADAAYRHASCVGRAANGIAVRD
jgi:hypothetical protein